MLALNLRKMGYQRLLPVQTHAASILLSGKNLVVCAPTGSGKTAAFLIPAIELVVRYQKSNGRTNSPLVLILGNTQNLMTQIFDIARKMVGCWPNTGVRYSVRVYDLFGGGRGFRLYNVNNIEHEIVVATCGGVLKAFMQDKLDLSNLRLLVIDEADRMMDKNNGFGFEISQILSKVPQTTTVAEFSATFCQENNQLVLSDLEKMLFGDNTPIFINIAASRGDITQRVVEKDERVPDLIPWMPNFERELALLVGLIETDLNLHQMKKGGPYKKSTVIFVERKITANYVAVFLQQLGYDFEPISSDYALSDNMASIKKMEAGKIQGVVATNKLSRGQDIPDVDHVIIYEMSQDFDDYKHRIGRTSRMGRGGRATVMLSINLDGPHIIPLVEFMMYHNQAIPLWLQTSYQQMTDCSNMKLSISDSFVSARTEFSNGEENNNADSYMNSSGSSCNDNNLCVGIRRNSTS